MIFRRIDVFMLTVAFIVSVFIFGAIYMIVYESAINQIKEISIQSAEATARQTFNNMYQLMKKGWTRNELLEFLEGVQEPHTAMNMEVNIYRGRTVKDLFGDIKEKGKGKFVIQVFRIGEPIVKEEGNLIHYIYPLKARKDCLRCHINAKEGDVLGVIEVKQDISANVEKVSRSLKYAALLIIPIPLAGALFVMFILKERIEKSFNKLDESIEHVNRVSDLSSIRMEEIDFGFEEINRVRDSIGKLVHRLRNIAVDKEILEFEMKLLERFIITSEAIADWKGFLRAILIEVSGILNYAYFFTVFKESDDEFSVHVFWNCECRKKDKCEDKLESIIVDTLKKHNLYVAGASISFDHTYLDSVQKFNGCWTKDIRTLTKSLILEEPLIGGAVGIGVSISETESEVKKLAVEGLLSTLLNIIGSIKAINKYTKELEYFATRDPLTNLYNQRVFWELLEYEIEGAKRHNYKFALFVIDIDNFKLINDTYGHNFGDRFLREISKVLTKILRKEDIVARYGGDEFTIILPYITLKEVVKVAERLMNTFEKFSLKAPDNKAVKVTASVGIAIFPDHAEDAKKLFVLADNMMYKAKKEGKNKFIIPNEEDLAEAAREFANKSFLVLETVEKKNVIPFFQPIMNLRTKKVEAYEVLMRIQHGSDILSAAEFIHIAERIGVIHRLDYILMEKALQKVKDSGCKPIIFINLSPKALILTDFLKAVKSILKNFNFPYENIVFEITERETVRNLDMLKRFVENLKLEGFSFAVDDFGSGFASFTYIKFFPIDFIKIDG